MSSKPEAQTTLRCEAPNTHVYSSADRCNRRAVTVVDSLRCCRQHAKEFQAEAFLEVLESIGRLMLEVPASELAENRTVAARAINMAVVALVYSGDTGERDERFERPWSPPFKDGIRHV